LPGALGVLLLLALLTWLLLRGTAYAVTLRAFDDFSLAEASLHRDVLQGARRPASRLHTLVKTAAAAMEDAITWFRSYAQTEGLDAGPADC